MLKRGFLQFPTLIVAALTLQGMTGCSSHKPVIAPVMTEGVPNDWVIVSPPTVTVDHGVLTISGDIRRKPDVTGAISGRVDITVLGPEGGSLLWVPALLTPNPIPSEGRGESQYVMHYGYVPPAGSTVQVRFVDTATAKREDIDNTEKDATSGLRDSTGAFEQKKIGPYIGW